MAPDSGRRLAQLGEEDTEPAADVSSMSDAHANITSQAANVSSVPDRHVNEKLSPECRQNACLAEFHNIDTGSRDAVKDLEEETAPPRRRSNRLSEVIDHGSETETADPLRDVNNLSLLKEETSSPCTISLTPALPPEPLEGHHSNTFPFFGLSAELRNRIYSMALCEARDGYDSNLAALKFPSITRASRQLRQESLAFLFAERNFVLYVGSDLAIRSEMRIRGGAWLEAFGSTRKESSSQCGTLGFKNIVSEFMKSAGASALFRDTTFEVYPGEQVKDARYDTAEDPAHAQRWQARHHIATLNLKVGDRYRLVASHSFKEHQGSFNLIKGFTTVDITTMLEEVTEAARLITVRDGFKGFTTLDLTRIAKAFRFKKNSRSVRTVALRHGVALA